jgi:gas vesicle protein
MGKAGKFFLGAIFGGILGAAAAILLAPGSGDETRNSLKERVNHLAKEFKIAMQERKQELEAELKEFKRLD